MHVITALTVQKKNPDRVNLFLDGEFAFGLPIDVATKLTVNQKLSPEEINALQRQDLLEKARLSALRLLSYRPRSVAEVQRHLNRKGYDEQLIVLVTERLEAVDLLNDEAFARYWLEQRETFKPRSRLALKQELHQKGISQHIINETLRDVDETASARRAAEKKAKLWANLPAHEFQKKLGQFLHRRGFHYEIIKQITYELWQSRERDADTDENAVI